MPSYRETIPLPTWVSLLLVALFAVSLSVLLGLRDAIAADAPRIVWLWDASWIFTLVLCVGVPLFLGRLAILVEGSDLVLRFGFVPAIEQRVPLALIERAEAVEYQPIRQFGGWGIRRGTFRDTRTAVYSVRGSTGALLALARPLATHFLRTDRILVGSGDPLALVMALERSASGPLASAPAQS